MYQAGSLCAYDLRYFMPVSQTIVAFGPGRFARRSRHRVTRADSVDLVRAARREPPILFRRFDHSRARCVLHAARGILAFQFDEE